MKLTVLKNNVPHNEVDLDFVDSYGSYEIFIGRSDDCHVIIDDPLISRHHLVLKNIDNKWICEKISELGTLVVNGSLTSRVEIFGGEELKFGPYTLIPLNLPLMSAATATKTPKDTEIISHPIADDEILDSHSTEKVNSLDSENDLLDKTDDEFGSQDDEDTEYKNLDSDYDDKDSQEMSLVSSENSGGDSNDTDFSSGEYNDEYAGNELSTYENADGDEGGGFEEREESTRFFKAFINYQLVLFGEFAPYDRYQIDGDEVYIGRDPNKCQILLSDPEVSSVHAVIRKSGNEVTLEDLNSSNGTLLHGERINKANLQTGDEFLIGSTTFTLDVRSDLLEIESDRLMPVEADQYIETEEYEEIEIDADDENGFNTNDEVEEKSIIKRILKNPAKRKKAIYIVGGSLLAFLILYEPEEAAPPKKAPEQKTADTNAGKVQLSPEMENKRNVAYELGVSFFEQNKYFEALKEFEVVAMIDPEYKNNQTYLEQTKLGLKQLEELEARKRAEEERIALKKVIEELLVKARESVKERQVQVAETYFAQIVEKDPENMEVQQLRLELDIWQKEEQRKKLELAAKEAARKKMVDALAPGKTFYLKRDWYRAILKLEEFLNIKGNDEDLIQEASNMLSSSRSELSQDLGPILGRARSLKEGQDLKNAYDAFLEVLKIEPTNEEALNEIDNIKHMIDSRSKRLYREAIISESLSLFTDAKEKLQEVQQISPTDSEYYKKANDKLKTYLD